MLPGIASPVTQATVLPQPSFSPGTPEWGHSLITPEGREIRVPAFAFRKLRQLGALMGNSNRLSPRTYEFVRPEFNCISEGIGRVLGEDLSGPAWVLCTCKDCQRRAAESDRTALPGRNRLDDERTTALVREITRNRKFG